ncbi:hypothetical protein [Pseudarthrobacter sp. PS3-L1]|uniref:hypothetical protein n=1 Tax=Pseudarthrobacter sp. PS3-L1 TaxID=3046207 RepID=UPI0024BB2874|nr:hypothetical protein [Pseudarthrobacter sp. PS3-L1]MDJ0319792.1 hypothetical protein [Pseudarthrobacter sp. PS3-L1]
MSPYKDLGIDSKATIITSSGLTVEGGLESSRLRNDVCVMSYSVEKIPWGDGPYAVFIGHRSVPEQTDTTLQSGAQLYIGK